MSSAITASLPGPEKYDLANVKEGSFSLHSLKEAQSLSQLLATLSPEHPDLQLGLLELLVNGIEHGNLGITFNEKGELLKNGTWQAEIERRLNLKKYCHKKVRIEFKRTKKQIKFTIEDEGAGFDSDKYIADPPENGTTAPSTCLHGRGIKLANQLCFDHLKYLGTGSKVTATINLS